MLTFVKPIQACSAKLPMNLLNKTRQMPGPQVTKVGSQVKSRRGSQVSFKSCNSPSQVIIPEWSDSQV